MKGSFAPSINVGFCGAVIYYLRAQRMGLVQSVEQYKFIFKVLRDLVKEELEAALPGTAAKRDNGLMSS